MTFLRNTSRTKLIVLAVFIMMIVVHAGLIFACVLGCKLSSVDSLSVYKRKYVSQRQLRYIPRTAIAARTSSVWYLYQTRVTKNRNSEIPEEKVYVDIECNQNEALGDACVDTTCLYGTEVFNATKMSVLPTRKLPMPTFYQEFIRSRRRSKRHSVVIMSATSSAQFLDTLLFLKNVQEVLFPVLMEYDFQLVVYDLGLTNDQRSQLEDLCSCHVIDFPSESVSGQNACTSFRHLAIAAHLPVAKVLLWVDVSLRFKPFNASSLFKLIRTTGVVLTPTNRSLGKHLSEVSTLFESACSYYPYRELDTKFLGFYNDDFVQEAVIAPWLSSNADRNYICDKTKQSMHDEGENVSLNDQLSLNVILVKLFQKRIGMITIPHSFYRAEKKEISSSLGRSETLW